MMDDRGNECFDDDDVIEGTDALIMRDGGL